jgi:hypothetical protein
MHNHNHLLQPPKQHLPLQLRTASASEAQACQHPLHRCYAFVTYDWVGVALR